MIFSKSVPPYFEPMSKTQTQQVYLSRGDVGGYSFQNSDVTAFDVQHTEHWAAFIHKCFTPVFIILKLLTLHTQSFPTIDQWLKRLTTLELKKMANLYQHCFLLLVCLYGLLFISEQTRLRPLQFKGTGGQMKRINHCVFCNHLRLWPGSTTRSWVVSSQQHIGDESLNETRPYSQTDLRTENTQALSIKIIRQCRFLKLDMVTLTHKSMTLGHKLCKINRFQVSWPVGGNVSTLSKINVPNIECKFHLNRPDTACLCSTLIFTS